jgi:hypothetical protein
MIRVDGRLLRKLTRYRIFSSREAARRKLI